MGSTGSGGTLWPLVKALRQLPCMQSLAERIFVVQLLNDRLGSLRVDEIAQIQPHIFNIVEACARRPDGFAALLEVVSELDQGVTYLREVQELIAKRAVLDVWPDEEREQLFPWLSGMIFTDLLDLYHQVAGPSAPELPAQTTYREVFRTLETLNANPDGLPKPIVFVEHLAKRLPHELAIELRRWADRQANRLQAVTALQAMRREFPTPPSGPAPDSPAYLVLLLRHYDWTAQSFLLCSWTQLGLSEGWHPERGEDFVGSMDDVRRQVATLIESVETKWARFRPDIRIEVVLSGELMGLDIDQWSCEMDNPLLVPIGCRYAFATRSLDRMQTGKWHRPWFRRWDVLTGQLANGGVARASAARREPGKPIRSLVAKFERDPDLVTLQLSAPPDPVANGDDEIAVGLRAGVPVMVWHRRDCDSEEFLAAAEDVFHGEGSTDILQRTKQIRTVAYESHSGHVGRGLTLLYDDPTRLVVPFELAPPEGASGQ